MNILILAGMSIALTLQLSPPAATAAPAVTPPQTAQSSSTDAAQKAFEEAEQLYRQATTEANKKSAIAKFEEALKLFRATNSRLMEAATLNYIGRVYSELGEKQKALEYYQQSLSLFRAAGDRRGEAVTLHSYLWVVTSTKLTSYELPKRADIETAANNFRDTATNRVYRNITQRVAKASQSLSQLILQPPAASLGQKRLLIVPDGVLHYTPFAALSLTLTAGQNASNFLIARHEIITLPSASTLGILRQNYADRKQPSRTLAILADPVFSPDDERVKGKVAQATTEKLESNNIGLNRSIRASNMSWPPKRLPFTRKEADIILSLVPSVARTQQFDFAASRATATDGNLANYQIVHFATHGIANSQNPALSGILMSMVDDKGNLVNGFLRLTDIFNLKLAANLVVLSACQTGLGQNIQGEGMVGLTRGFMYAGAQRVAVSLWNVDDEGTSLLMQNFYQKMLQEKLAPAAALRAAQMELMSQEKWSSPYYWAAFTLQGDWK